MGTSPARSFGGLECSLNYGREAVVVSGLPECLPAGPCACSTAVDWG